MSAKGNRQLSLSVFLILCVVGQECQGESPLYKFVMKDSSGKDVSLSQYKGKVNNIDILLLQLYTLHKFPFHFTAIRTATACYKFFHKSLL